MTVRALAAAASLAVIALAPCAQAYGPRGHAIVGAIADRLLANKPVAGRITDLLDGLSLADAALLADDIKTWDGDASAELHRLVNHPEISAQLHAFWAAHPDADATGQRPSHRWFHYTDVPVTGQSEYTSGTTGRAPYDVVQMVRFCIRVLKGAEPEDNVYKITKPVAVILLAHYVGDMHQPLHVGAIYFDAAGQPVNPDTAGSGRADEGGNTLQLIFSPTSAEATNHGELKLHSYWDGDTVDTALALLTDEMQTEHPVVAASITDAQRALYYAQHEPATWKMSSVINVEDWSLAWANEILPDAREAHRRLRYQNIHPGRPGEVEGSAVANGHTYPKWAGRLIKGELHKAGWRLAALLELVVP